MAESRYKVYCEWCQEWHYTDEVEVLNIEEDIQRRDVLHFKCRKPASWNEDVSGYDGTSSIQHKADSGRHNLIKAKFGVEE
jgi:hypothetical protein